MFKILILSWAILANSVGANNLAAKIEQPLVKSSAPTTVINLDIFNSLPKPGPIPKLTNVSDLNISAESYLLFDTNSATVLAEKEGHTKRPFASTIKFMTGLLAIENYQLDQVVTISHNAAAQTGSDMALKENEKITVRNLLYGLFLNSGNDAAMALAEQMGSSTIFIARMNQRANELGLSDTHFNDPAGLDEVNTISTAYDMAKLMSYDLHNPTILELIKTKDIVVNDVSGKITHRLQNSDKLLTSDYPGIIGGKTGTGTFGSYKDENGKLIIGAGHCLLAAADQNGYRLVAVIAATYLNTHDASANEARKLLDFGFSHIQPNNKESGV